MIVCTICGEEKDDEEFYFVAGKKAQKGVRRQQCKTCMSKRQKDNFDSHMIASHKHQRLYPHRVWATSVMSSHKRNGYKIEITLNQLESLALKVDTCPICGVELDYSRLTKNGKNLHNSPSIDRKSNGDTLTKSNVWIICKECNVTKGRRTMKQFAEYCKMVSEKYV
jgi:5-methylcytosine-specific restriction endonuclease McrA